MCLVSHIGNTYKSGILYDCDIEIRISNYVLSKPEVHFLFADIFKSFKRNLGVSHMLVCNPIRLLPYYGACSRFLFNFPKCLHCMLCESFRYT